MTLSFRLLGFALMTCSSLSSAAFAIDPSTLPKNGQVVSGSASIGQSGTNMDIHQSSNRATLQWQSFDVGSGAQVQFHQPSQNSVALNRVQAGNASQIHGNVRANGQVYLVNPSGVVFGPSARVDVGGLVASTHNISDADFNNGINRFQRKGAKGKIINQGQIHAADGGTVALIAPQVSNQGKITANGGNIALAAGETVRLNAGANGFLQIAVDGATVAGLVENGGVLQADGGQVVLNAQAANAMLSSVVANTGNIQAQTVQSKDGRILLLADMQDGEVRVDGSLDASAQQGGNGGFIETSAAHVNVRDTAKVTTKAVQGKAGTWRIDPDDYTIAAAGGNMTGAALSAALQGGNVQIETNQAGVSGNGDIVVDDAVSWTADNELHLLADRNIDINANLSATGANAGLILEYGRTTAGSNYSLNNGARIILSGATPSLQIGESGSVQNFTIINNVTDLQGMTLAGRFALGSHIDASATAGWNAGAGFNPLGDNVANFIGLFHGLGNHISDLTINRPAEQYVGLFGFASNITTIRDVGLEGGSVTGLRYVGSLIGRSDGGELYNVYSSADVSGNELVGGLLGRRGGVAVMHDAYATGNVTGFNNGGTDSVDIGGLIGRAVATTITDVYATGNVSGVNRVGGLMGRQEGTLENAYATGTVTNTAGGFRNAIGGLLGRSDAATTVNNTYATGNVVGGSADSVGGLIGRNEATVTDSYATGDVSGRDNIGGLVGNVINGGLSDVYATGDVSGRDYIGGLIGLNTRNISDAYVTNATVTGTGAYVGGLVGQSTDGDFTNVDVTSDTISGTGNYVGGLVGELGSSAVTDAHVVIDAVNGGGQNTGGLIGAAHTNSTIDDSSATATVNGASNYTGGLIGALSGSNVTDSYAITEVTGGLGTGGLIGKVADAWPDNSIIRNSYVRGTFVDGSGVSSVGGLIGWSSNNPVIEDSYALIDVIGDDAVGGLIGLHEGWGTLTVSRSWAGGDVTATGTDTGGFIGYAGGTGDPIIIEDSYASGNVTGTDNVGGLIGYGELLDITNSYASGTVSGTTDVGGLVGEYPTGTIVSSYWNSQTSGAAAGVANGAGAGVTALTTAQIQSMASFVGWDIDDAGGGASVWRIYEGLASPLLRNFLTPLTVTADDSTIYTTQAPFSGSVSYSTAPDMSLLLGTLDYGAAQGATEAGIYAITPSGLYSSQTGYDISYVDGTLTINAAPSAPPPSPSPPSSPPASPPSPEPTPPSAPSAIQSPDSGEIELYAEIPQVHFSDTSSVQTRGNAGNFLTFKEGYIPLQDESER